MISENLDLVLVLVAVFSCLVSLSLWGAYHHRRPRIERIKDVSSAPGLGTAVREENRRVSRIQAVSGAEDDLMASLTHRQNDEPHSLLDVEFSKGDYRLPGPLKRLNRLCFRGVSAGVSVLRSVSGTPGLCLERVRECLVSGLTIEGGVRCSEGDLTIENCVLENGEVNASLEATHGSVVTFSGTIARRKGGVAIRASGRSRVVLKPPFDIDEDDRVFLEPGCEIIL